MDMTCRCKKDYTCVACKVKRGDYKDWIEKEALPPTSRGYRRCLDCKRRVVRGPRCASCAQTHRYRRAARRVA